MDQELQRWELHVAPERCPSTLAIFFSLVLAALAVALVGAVLFASFVLWAILVDLGIPVTVSLGAIFALYVERRMIWALTGWRPRLSRLVLSAVPGAAVALAVDRALAWSAWHAIPTAVGIGLAVQTCGLVLSHRLDEAAVYDVVGAGDVRRPG